MNLVDHVYRPTYSCAARAATCVCITLVERKFSYSVVLTARDFYALANKFPQRQ